MKIREILNKTPVIPVLEISRPNVIQPLIAAIIKGGLSVVEITLRTPSAITAIEELSRQYPELIVGAGTVGNKLDMNDAIQAGARFLTSPGSSGSLIEAANTLGIPYLPGVSTPSEVAHLIECGVDTMKLFPAEAVGGISWLDSIYRPFPQAKFYATGGLSESLAEDYLGLANVSCVGGSWITPNHLIQQECWDEIELRSRKACSLASYQ